MSFDNTILSIPSNTTTETDVGTYTIEFWLTDEFGKESDRLIYSLDLYLEDTNSTDGENPIDEESDSPDSDTANQETIQSEDTEVNISDLTREDIDVEFEFEWDWEANAHEADDRIASGEILV